MNRSLVLRLLRLSGWIAVLGFLLVFTACGGKHGTLTLTIVTGPASAGADPFVDAATVRFTIIDSSHVSSAPVSQGKFTFKITQKPDDGKAGVITVDALDASGKIIGHGVSPSLTISATDQTVAIWVGRVGTVTSTGQQMSVQHLVTAADGTQSIATTGLPLTETTATTVVGLGVFFAGGRGADGKAVSNSAVWDVYTQSVIPTGSLTTARAGAVLAPIAGVQAAAYGGASGADPFGSPLDSGELFDPTVNTGVWSALKADPFPARSFPTAIVLGSGNTLISGGADGNGAPLGSAAQINPSGVVQLSAIMSPMLAPRLFHAAAPAHFPDGDGALLFGGLAAGSTGPVAERFLGNNFVAYDLGAGVTNRLYATATTMPSGDILILGGADGTGVAQASGFLVKPTLPATVTPLPNALSSPRARHIAVLSGQELVVCGGVANTSDLTPATLANDPSMKTCDILDATSYAILRTVTLQAPRFGMAAAKLETGPVVIACGTDPMGNPSAAIDMFTPTPAQ